MALLCRNFQRFTLYSSPRYSPSMLVACCSMNHSLFQLQQNDIMTQCHETRFLHRPSVNRHIYLHYHPHRDISIKTVLIGSGAIILIKKFIGLKILQWYGWKRMYRQYVRQTRKMMKGLPEHKKERSRKILHIYSAVARKTYDLFDRHPNVIRNWTLLDQFISNTIFYIPRKMKLALHRWLASQLELQKERNRRNPVYKYAKQWNGPLMLDTPSLVAYSNMYVLSRYVLMRLREKQLFFDIAFVLSNRSDIVQLGEQIEQRWKENPHEYERKQYVNLLKLKLK